MFKMVEIPADQSGFGALLGKRITLFCLNYIYTGVLTGVNEKFVLLTGSPAIVYETGPFSEKKWKDAQALPNDELYVMTSAIESFAIVKA